MKKYLLPKLIIIIIALALCCLMVGVSFALYSVNAQVNVSITAVAPTKVLSDIAVQYTGTNIAKNQTLNTSDVTVTAYYSDSTNALVTNWTHDLVTSAVGEKTVTVSYTEGGVTKTKTFTVAVTDYQGDCTLLGIESDWYTGTAMTLNTGVAAGVTEYMLTKVYIPASSSLTILYNGNFYNAIKANSPIGAAIAESNNFSVTAANYYDIYFTYDNPNSAEEGIYIAIHKTLTSVSATYSGSVYQTDGLNGSNLTVTASYADGTSRILTSSQYSLGAFDSSATGTKTVSVSYTEESVTVNNTFEISVVTAPAVYLVGSFNSWTSSNEYKFSYNSGAYSLSNLDIPADTSYKIISNGNWYPAANIEIPFGGVYNFTSDGVNVSNNVVSYYTDIYYLQIKRNGVIQGDSPTLSLSGSQYQIENLSLASNDEIRVYNPKLGFSANFAHTKGIDAVGSMVDGFLKLDRADTYGFYLVNPDSASETIYVASTTTKYVLTVYNAGSTVDGCIVWGWAWAEGGNGRWYKSDFTQGASSSTAVLALASDASKMIMVWSAQTSVTTPTDWGSLGGPKRQSNEITLPAYTNTLTYTY